MIKIFNSYVKHHYIAFKRVDYVEGTQNNVTGYIQNHKVFLTYTNSFGEDTRAVGKIWFFGSILFLSITAFGYSKFPKGTRVMAIGWKSNKHIRCFTARSIRRYLSACVDYEEFDEKN
jgi:hypothetical protein